jgi:hypothetical protein
LTFDGIASKKRGKSLKTQTKRPVSVITGMGVL